MNNLQVHHNFWGLNKWIKNTNSSSSEKSKKKVIYEHAVKCFRNHSLKSTYTAKVLPNLSDFTLTKKRNPRYFKEKFKQNTINELKPSNGYYTYQKTDKKYSEYWVDFANRKLGGGAFGRGFVQEEIMVAEMPELANHIANHLDSTGHCTLNTRKGSPRKAEQVKKGSPCPIVFKGIHRVQQITGIYGRKIDSISTENIKNHITSLKNPAVINIVAMAAPKLPKGPEKQKAKLDVIQDLFNTAMAGFTACKSARHDKNKRVLIHTGRFGAGAFNNNPRVVYVVQKLAAQHLGVDIKFYDYDSSLAKEASDDYNKILQEFNNPKNQDHSIENLLAITSKVMQARL